MWHWVAKENIPPAAGMQTASRLASTFQNAVSKTQCKTHLNHLKEEYTQLFLLNNHLTRREHYGYQKPLFFLFFFPQRIMKHLGKAG